MARTRLVTAVMIGALIGALLPAVAVAEPLPAPPETVAEELEGLPALRASGSRMSALSRDAEQPVSEPVETPIPFTLVGFEVPVMAADLDPPLELRVSTDGERWTDWIETELLVEDDKGPDAPEAADAGDFSRFTEPVWVGEATWLQTRGAAPEHVRVHLIDSAGLSQTLGDRLTAAVRSWLVPAPAAAAAGLDVITRRQWGANESWRRGSPRYASAVRFAVVHHTATSNGYSRADGPAVVRAIYRYHTQSLGWSDIGYNVLVDRYGQIYEGRYGGVTAGVVGSHAAGFNTGSFGVSVIGEFTSSAPPVAAQEAVADVLAQQVAVHGFDPTGTVVVTSGGGRRYPAGTQVRIPTIIGHRDVGLTACPGTAFYNRLSWLRGEAANRVGDVQIAFCAPGGPSPAVQADQRVRTSVAASKWYWRESTDAVVASSEDFPDALAGAALAARLDAPLFLTGQAALHADVVAQLAALGVQTVWLLGGTAALGPAVERAAASVPGVSSVRRIGGTDRFATAALVADVAGAPAGEAVVARGRAAEAHQAWPDAISGASLAATPQRLPALLVDGDRVPDETLAALRDAGVHTVYVLGGTAAVPESVVGTLRARGLHVTRLGGADRYETSVLVARLARSRFDAATTPVFLAAGTDFGDALVAGAVAARRGGPVLLTGPCGTRFASTAGAYLQSEGSRFGEAVIVGGGRLTWQALN